MLIAAFILIKLPKVAISVLPFDNLYYKSDRSSSCYEQSFLDVLEKIIQKCIYLPIYHTLTFYCLHFSKKKNVFFPTLHILSNVKGLDSQSGIQPFDLL